MFYRVNFLKNEKAYDSTKSEVFKMLQEVESEPQDADPEADPDDAERFSAPIVKSNPVPVAAPAAVPAAAS